MLECPGWEQRGLCRVSESGKKPALVAPGSQAEPLRVCVERAVEAYFECLNGEASPVDLYGMVLGEVEAPLLEIVMRQVQGNQSRAADILGMNRGTLRKKLKQYQLI